MRSLLYSLAICGFVFSTGVALADPDHGHGHGYGHGNAPAPEMGASLFGLAMAGALTYYIVRQRRKGLA